MDEEKPVFEISTTEPQEEPKATPKRFRLPPDSEPPLGEYLKTAEAAAKIGADLEKATAPIRDSISKMAAMLKPVDFKIPAMRLPEYELPTFDYVVESPAEVQRQTTYAVRDLAETVQELIALQAAQNETLRLMHDGMRKQDRRERWFFCMAAVAALTGIGGLIVAIMQVVAL